MKVRIVFRPQRWRRAIAAGSVVTIWAFFIIPTVGMAGTVLTYKDKFNNESFSGSDGTASWAGPWMENGESDGPDDGAIEVDSDSHCVSGNCLLIGEEDPDDASVSRAYDSSAASSVVLAFDFARHVSSSGPGSGGAGVVKLLASSNGASWNVIDSIPLNIDDPSTIGASYDLTAFAGPASAIKFELVGGIDDSFISIDNVIVTVTSGVAPTTTTTTTTLPTTTTTLPITTTSTSPPTTSTSPTTTTAPPTTTTTRVPTTTTAPPPSTTTTSTPRTTTTLVSGTKGSPVTSTTAPPRPGVSTAPPQTEETPPLSTSTSTTTTQPTTTTTHTGALVPLPEEPPPFTPEQAKEAKEGLVAGIPDVGQNIVQAPDQDRSDYRLDPREGLAVSFTSAVETLKGNLLNSVLLGVIISVLLLLGIDRREERASLRISAV